jgi:hypothetical protein
MLGRVESKIREDVWLYIQSKKVSTTYIHDRKYIGLHRESLQHLGHSPCDDVGTVSVQI